MPDGRLVNFDNVLTVGQENKSLNLLFVNGKSERVDYASASDAATALAGLLASTGGTSSIRGMFYLTPNSALAGGGAAVTVVTGVGFTKDLVGANWTGTITIGGDSTAATYVNDTTLLLSWNTGSPGSVDVVYTTADGQVFTLPNYFVYE